MEGESLERECDPQWDAVALVVAWGEVVTGLVLVGPGGLVGHVLIYLGG